jgi:hypothetical protein
VVDDASSGGEPDALGYEQALAWSWQQQQQPPVGSDGQRLTLREELETLKLSQLRKRAVAAGVAPDRLDEADDSETPRAAYIAILITRRYRHVRCSGALSAPLMPAYDDYGGPAAPLEFDPATGEFGAVQCSLEWLRTDGSMV